MNDFKYRWILYTISGVILATLCIQVYWNFKIYESGKQQLQNDVRTSIDKAVDNYYTRLAKNSTFNYIGDSIQFVNTHKYDTVFYSTDSSKQKKKIDLKIDATNKGITLLESKHLDTSEIRLELIDNANFEFSNDSLLVFLDSLRKPFERLTSKIMVSFSEDQFSLPKIDSFFTSELQQRNLFIDYGLSLSDPMHKIDSIRPESIKKAQLKSHSTSPYFFRNNTLTVHYSNVTLAILKKNLVSIVLSFILVLSVIASLLYLLKIIKHQKQLAEVKNDLINNITHEFKTPIATIGAAMEGIQVFNEDNTAEKNVRYAKIADEQVKKLNAMVEKLLETATLDSEKLPLCFEEINIVEFLRRITTERAATSETKTISFESSEVELVHTIDAFHFENVINNIIDNAIKYGGDDILVSLSKRDSLVEICISDSGTTLLEKHKSQIFEKFYRIPKGNTHDVKGYGIGLYYAKKIIEKHRGTIELIIEDHTKFKITLPNGPYN
jgi:two-component system phosphate regulon sensor histidine kinase PhoR